MSYPKDIPSEAIGARTREAIVETLNRFFVSSVIANRAADAVVLALSGPTLEETIGKTHKIEHDGFEGTVQGSYVTREGKRGVVLQQLGTKVVHVYGEKWIK